jgi:hypothetical protein
MLRGRNSQVAMSFFQTNVGAARRTGTAAAGTILAAATIPTRIIARATGIDIVTAIVADVAIGVSTTMT